MLADFYLHIPPAYLRTSTFLPPGSFACFCLKWRKPTPCTLRGIALAVLLFLFYCVNVPSSSEYKHAVFLPLNKHTNNKKNQTSLELTSPTNYSPKVCSPLPQISLKTPNAKSTFRISNSSSRIFFNPLQSGFCQYPPNPMLNPMVNYQSSFYLTSRSIWHHWSFPPIHSFPLASRIPNSPGPSPTSLVTSSQCRWSWIVLFFLTFKYWSWSPSGFSP